MATPIRHTAVVLVVVFLAAAAGALADAGGNIVGTEGDDTLSGTPHRDDIAGEAGNDKLYGYGSRDDLDGGDGDDQLFGGRGRDTLRGGAGSDVLRGGKGRDTIEGGDGNDFISGLTSNESRSDDGNVPDEISCGGGTDIVYADKRDRVADDCETVKRLGKSKH